MTSGRFISISSALPESSNIKMVEVWMLFTNVLPFLEVVLQSYVNYILRKSLPEDEKEAASREVVVVHKTARHRGDGPGLWGLSEHQPAKNARQVHQLG
jgi:hypothetical protein